MDKRILNFVLVAVAVLFTYQMVARMLFPPAPLPPGVQEVAEDPDAEKDPEAKDDPADDPEDTTETPPAEPDPGAIDEPPSADGRPRGVAVLDERPERLQLGSLSLESPYRMLTTINTTGATIERIELSNPRYRDIEDKSGYMGHLALRGTDDAGGAVVGIVGPGTPAEEAGLLAGDIITQINETTITGVADVERVMAATEPRNMLAVTVVRDGEQLEPVSVTLTRRPLEIVRPELAGDALPISAVPNPDELSLRMTLERAGGKQIEEKQREIPGVDLYAAQWWVLDEPDADDDQIALIHELPELGVQVIKRFTLAKLPAAAGEIDNGAEEPAYHLTVGLEIKNISEEPQSLAYRLDGPTGLPTEGWWYSSRTSRNWTGGAGARDVIFQFVNRDPAIRSAYTVARDVKAGETVAEPTLPLAFVGVDAQYFASILIPQKESAEAQWIQRLESIVVGEVPEDKDLYRKTNVTCRLTSVPEMIEAGQSLRHEYVLFAGPKTRKVLEQYGPPFAPEEYDLSSLIYYGMSIWGVFAQPMSHVLHFFYSFVGNYGLAVIMLTVLVRLCMFPISRKQALNAQKMQELQPEFKKIAEKYKNDLKKRGEAMSELQRKHKYNPLSGCLPMFIQLPIFIGLYRALMIDVELRDAPLISETFGWATNLGAPDMLWYWEPYLPAFLAAETGFLGPYLNLLPLLTVGLFIWQQKMFMPPPADEQQAMQHKVMRFMMVFMGFMFFKVASGLCLYFIASSLWGIAERKILPKAQHAREEASKEGATGKKPADSPQAIAEKQRKAERAKAANALKQSSTNGSAKKGDKRRRQKGSR